MFSCCCADQAPVHEVLTELAQDVPAVSAEASAEQTGIPKEAAAAAGEPASPQPPNEPPKKDEQPPKKPMTAPVKDRACRTSLPLEAAIEEGVFLMYDSAEDTIFAHWSKAPKANALAWLRPQVAVPAHKFKVNGGKQILFNKTAEDNKYYQGWIKFVLLTTEFPGKIMLLDNFAAAGAPPVRVWQLIEGPGSGGESAFVAEAMQEYNKLYDLKNVKAVAVVPENSTLIEPNKPLNPQKFLQMGKGEGDASQLATKKK